MIKLVICDDHHLVAEGIQLMLQDQKDIEIVGMTFSGTEALALLQKETVDILILDISMPQMDGITVLKTLQNNNSNTKVLILTMHDQTKYIEAVIAYDAAGYLLKNSSKKRFLQAIKRIANGEKYYDEAIMPKLVNALQQPLKQKNEAESLLTSRELDIVKLIVKGNSTKKIAEELFISVNTVLSHRKNIYSKLNVHSVSELMQYVFKHDDIFKDES